ncbi:hypothetical protein V8E54_000616 [Elaphomyces granulatus]
MFEKLTAKRSSVALQKSRPSKKLRVVLAQPALDSPSHPASATATLSSKGSPLQNLASNQSYEDSSLLLLNSSIKDLPSLTSNTSTEDLPSLTPINDSLYSTTQSGAEKADSVMSIRQISTTPAHSRTPLSQEMSASHGDAHKIPQISFEELEAMSKQELRAYMESRGWHVSPDSSPKSHGDIDFWGSVDIDYEYGLGEFADSE